MPGRHAAPGYGGFARELVIFVLKVLFWGAIVFGAVLLFQVIFPGDDSGDTTTTSPSTTVTADGSTASTLPPTTTTVAPTTTSTEATTTTIATTTTLAGRNPSEITVLVLNSTNRSGLAADLADTLADVGYQTAEPENWETPFTVSRIWYVDGFESEARAIAQYVSPDAIVELFQGVTQADIIIVIGASYGA